MVDERLKIDRFERFGSDPKRRRELLEELDKFWAARPTMRFTQMVYAATLGDPFYVEDAELMGVLRSQGGVK